MHPFRAAVEAQDLDAMVACLAEDVVFNSPVVFKPYEGREATAMVLAAVFQVFEDFAYTDEIEGDGVHALLFRTRVGDKAVQGIDILRTGADGLVTELTVMLRPLSGTLAVAEAMREKLAAA
jgi:limonene-1,2-epoxide hydrolase